MTCKDCFHYGVCIWTQVETKDMKNCKDFKNKADFVELPYKPFPVVMAVDENNSDVFCPFCDTDLSGHYYGGDFETPKIVPCFECGAWLDGTKAITKEEFKNLYGERK